MEFTRVGLGGSCHWCTEAIFQSLLGVSKVEQGWVSSIEYPTLSEAVIVHFDSSFISLAVLIEIHLHTHSSTSTHAMREKYRSAIYVFSESQREIATQAIKQLQSDFKLPIITEVQSFDSFELNKQEYLNYYYSNPEKAFCKNQIYPKLRKLLLKFKKSVDTNKFDI